MSTAVGFGFSETSVAVGLTSWFSALLPVALGVAGGMLLMSTKPHPVNAKRTKASIAKLFINKRTGLFLNLIENLLVSSAVDASKTGVIPPRASPGADPGRLASHHPAN